MTRITLTLLGIALMFLVACGGDDKGGVFGGGGGGNTNDPVAFAARAFVTQLAVFSGAQDPQKLLDLYLPECRTGVKPSDVTAALAMIKAFFPEISKLKVEDIDLAGPKVEKNGNEVKLTITDVNKVRVKADGKFVNANDYFKSVGFKDPGDSPLEGLEKPLLLKEQDGKLYLSDCSDLQDLASAGPQPTPTPQRTSASPTPQRTTTAGPTSTPGRTATTTIGRDLATPSRGTTPSAVATVVRTTPTSAQRYTDALQKEFMDDCTGAGAATSVCRCMLDILNARFTVAQYREFEAAVNRNERQGELNAVVQACVR